MSIIINSLRRKMQTGQSMVETALFLPIFIVLLAGVIEVGNLVLTQNRVTSAARAATRYAANGGIDDGMAIVALNSVTQTLQMSEGLWDMWAVRATVNADGDDFSQFEISHIYGISNTTGFANFDQQVIRNRILANLGNSNPQRAEVELVASVLLYDTDSILGMNAMPWLQGLYTIQGLNVMRITSQIVVDPTIGCDAFPIAVGKDIYSVNATTFNNIHRTGNTNLSFANYDELIASHPDHVADQHLWTQAQLGQMYLIQNGSGSGNFGWLRLNPGGGGQAATVLAASLTWPGDSTDPVTGFRDALNPADRTLRVGSQVGGSSGSIVSADARAQLDSHISRGRTLRVIVYDEATSGGGVDRFRAARFGLFKLHGYNLTQSGGAESWILGEFIQWDDSCGQTLP